MANPRQRRKAKSSTHKAISHSKRAKRLQKKMPGEGPNSATSTAVASVLPYEEADAELSNLCSNLWTESFARCMGPI